MTPGQDAELRAKYPALFPSDVSFDVGPGWFALVDRIARELGELEVRARAVQVKEKFGALRFYIELEAQDLDERVRDEVFATIERVQDESVTICENCGAPGTPGGRGWVKTLCAPCRQAGQSRP